MLIGLLFFSSRIFDLRVSEELVLPLKTKENKRKQKSLILLPFPSPAFCRHLPFANVITDSECLLQHVQSNSTTVN
jgi:hypothetical protein